SVGVGVAGRDRRPQALDEVERISGRVALRLDAAGRADRGAAVEGGRALGRDEQLRAVAADRLADPQLDDRHLVHRVAAEDEDRAGGVYVGGGDGEVGGCEPGPGRAAEPAAGGRGDVLRAEHAADEPLDQPSLLVRRAAADDRCGAADRRGEAAGSRLERLLPARRLEAAAAADLRRQRPVGAGEHLIAEPALVAEPAVVDLLVVASEDADDLLVADGELDIAL